MTTYNLINRIQAELTSMNFRRKKVKPTIKRDVVRSQGYSVSTTDNFVKVVRDTRIEYYTDTADKHSPFWNVYRIDSRPDSDFIIHEVKDGHKTIVLP